MPLFRTPSFRRELPHRGLWLCLALLAAACDKDESPPGGEAGNAGNAGVAGAPSGGSPNEGGAGSGGVGATGGSGGSAAGSGGSAGSADAGAGPSDSTPLVERPLRPGYECEVQTPATRVELGANVIVTSTLAGDGQNAYLAHADAADVYDFPSALRLAPVSSDAAVGADTTIEALTDTQYASIEPVVGEDGVTLVLLKSVFDVTELAYAKMSHAGVVTTAPTRLTGLGSGVQALRVAPSANGIGLIWTASSAAGWDLDFGILHDDGSFENPAGVLRSSEAWMVPAALVATDQGFLASFVENGVTSGVYALAIANDGTAGTAHSLAEPTDGYFGIRHSLLWLGDEALLAWSNTVGTYEGEQLGSTIQLTRLDAGGARQGADVPASAWVRSQENVDPALFLREDGAVGLVWSRGSVIYICAGCMPDNRLEFVLFDPASFERKSEVLELTNPVAQGGLIGSQVAPLGDDVVVGSAIMYHTSRDSALAAIRCGATP